MHITKHANAIDDETVCLDWRLESLHTVPGHATTCIKPQYNGSVKASCSLLENDPRAKNVSQNILPNRKRNDRTDPSAIRMKSASPCTITVLMFFSMTLGNTVNAGGKLASSSWGKTSSLLHAVQFTSRGAWMAFLTSVRSK